MDKHVDASLVLFSNINSILPEDSLKMFEMVGSAEVSFFLFFRYLLNVHKGYELLRQMFLEGL